MFFGGWILLISAWAADPKGDSAGRASRTLAAIEARGANRISAILKENSAGFLLDEGGQDSWNRLVEAARNYARFRRGRMSAREKLLWIADCLSRPSENVFCTHLTDRKRGGMDPDDPLPFPVPARKFEPKAPALDPYRVADFLSAANLAQLQKLSEGQVHRALRLFNRWEPLQKVADAAIRSEVCVGSAWITALAQKGEEYLPDVKMRQTIISLYMRSAACGSPKDESAYKAQYRLSLFLIWDGRCREADPYLEKISTPKEGDFASRALYWRIYCAAQTGNTAVAAAVKNQLIRDFPLSYHGLLAGGGKRSPELGKFLKTAEPTILFRSASRPELNPAIRGAEALQSLQEFEYARELLDSADPAIEAAESGFRIYYAVLLRRSSDMIGQFRTLSRLFSDEPATIARATLELYYPLQRFETLKKHGTHTDLFLVAALIRQESGFNERARSPAGAMGLMQLMPNTARRMERVARRELFDASTNIRLGVKYFTQLLERFNLDAELALAAYNAGPEKVDQWMRRYTVENRVLFLDLIPFAETRNYVALISRNYFWYMSLYGEPGDASAPASSSVSLKRRPILYSMMSVL